MVRIFLRARLRITSLTSDDLPYRRGEMRNTFCPDARSRASRSRSSARSAKAAAVTISPYTNGLSPVAAITLVYVTIT
jgi:hypothetical protein